MLLSDLVQASAGIASTRSRLDKVGRLAEVLRRLAPEEIEVGASYLAGSLPQGKIGLGWDILRDARAGAGPAPAAGLTLAEVNDAFERIGASRGRGSAAERRRLLGAVMARATAPEQEFLLRLVIGELRQGSSDGLLAEGIARAAGLHPSAVRRAIMLAGETAAVARAALMEGAAGLARFRLVPGRPVLPMLAGSAEGVEEALTDLGEAAFEYKLDGARVQAHKTGGAVRVFSRRMNEVTERVPEVVEALRALPAREAILDGEAIALDAAGRPVPFQETMSRFGRRLEVEAARAERPLSVFFFDALYLDGEDLADLPARERIRRLAAELPSALAVPRLVTADPAAAGSFLDGALAAGHEGVMAKALDAPYEAGRRGTGWLKIKQAHTLDLVILAAEWGNGRREGWLSNLHLGARDPAGSVGAPGGFVMLGKTFKGLTDDMLRWQTERLLRLEERREGVVVFVRPQLVVEIAFNDIQASPHYPAGMALRFARVKSHRPDKSPADADTVETVRGLFRRQESAEEPA